MGRCNWAEWFCDPFCRGGVTYWLFDHAPVLAGCVFAIGVLIIVGMLTTGGLRGPEDAAVAAFACIYISVVGTFFVVGWCVLLLIAAVPVAAGLLGGVLWGVSALVRSAAARRSR